MAGFPPTRAFEAEIGGVRTQFVLTAYTNRIMVVVTQSQNMGTLVHAPTVVVLAALVSQPCSALASRRQIMACADDPLNPTGTSYSTRVLVGRRDDEALEAYARTLMELICAQSPKAGPLLLAISIKEHSNEIFRAIVQQIQNNRIW